MHFSPVFLFSLFLVFLALPFSPAAAHICLISPRQRGNFSIATPGFHGCYNKVGPVGITTPGPLTTLYGGQLYSISFQQNLNHYWNNAPGYLVNDYSCTGPNPVESDFNSSISWRIPDYNPMNEITQTNFTIPVEIPNIQCPHGVFRIRYFSNNPNENDRGEIFYTAADIQIIATNGEQKHSDMAPSASVSDWSDEAVSLAKGKCPVSLDLAANPSDLLNRMKQPAAAVSGCCTASEFTMSFSHFIANANYFSSGTIYYSNSTQMIRIDLQSGSGQLGTTNNGQFSMYMNFSSGIEWYYNHNTEHCDAYGLDQWSEWCYSLNGQNQRYAGIQQCPQCVLSNSTTELCQYWRNGDFLFANLANVNAQCEPRGILRMGLNTIGFEQWEYSNFNPAPVPASTFQAPSTCKLKHSAAGEPHVLGRARQAGHLQLLQHIRQAFSNA